MQSSKEFSDAENYTTKVHNVEKSYWISRKLLCDRVFLSPKLNMTRCCMRVCLSSSHLLLLSSSRSIRTRDACYRANPKQHVTPMHPAPPPPNVPVPVSPGGWMDHGSRARASDRPPPPTQRHRIIYMYGTHGSVRPGPHPRLLYFQLSVSSE